MLSMKYGVVGSRRRSDRESVYKFIDTLSLDDVVISGACRGVDTWAAERARQRGIKVIEHKPDLSKCKTYLDKVYAYYARNKLIAKDCDILIAFVAPDRKGGTENTISYAREFEKKILIY
jgi:predicted Rossmann fold nucleotide-binding protein DprA/Smf involved in DNA uptake